METQNDNKRLGCSSDGKLINHVYYFKLEDHCWYKNMLIFKFSLRDA